MELQEFVKKFAQQFDETDASEFEPGTIFKNLDEWSSLTALSVIAMIDDDYKAKVTGDNIKNASTIEDLFKMIA